MTGTLITRAQWGARRPAGNIGNIDPKGITVHYNGPPIGGYPWDHGRCAQLVRGTQAFHLDGRKWADIAYTAIVCHHGVVFEGRGLRQRTAAQGTNDGNARSLALMFLIGQGEPATEEARHAAVWWARDVARLPLRWVHSDWHSTACPGDPLRFWKATGFADPNLPASGPAPAPAPTPAPAPVTPPPPTLPVRPTVRTGDRGRTVGLLQLELVRVAPPITVDGVYGPGTADKVRGLQRMFGLTVDGVCGPATWRVIDFLYLKFGAPLT